MAEQRDEILAADRLAQLLGNQRGTEAIRLLQRFSGASRPSATRTMRSRPRNVGAYRLVDTPEGTGLRRRELPLFESCLWSTVEEVPGKGSASRVVLVGESVARGYLLDPIFNPAQALDRLLGADFQCVDLAQISIGLDPLRRLVRLAPHLDTDVLVLFAGNNWTVSSYESPYTQYTAGVGAGLRAGGYAGMRRALLDEVVIPQVQGLLDDLVDLRDRDGIRPVVVVPEFNLAGWSPLGAVNVVDTPMLPGDDLLRWYELRRVAVAEAGSGRWAEAVAAAEEMTKLDGGLSPVPGYIVGQARRATGDERGAREAFEQSRDSLCGLIVKYLPRTPTVVQDLLVEFCDRHDVDCVDLRETLGPDLPDPAHFLDYCHLSDSGIELAMKAVAATITGEHRAGEPMVSDRDRGVSLMLAAAYNSFCGQPAETIRSYLERALATWPGVRDLMAAFSRLLSRPGGPLWSAPDFPTLLAEPNVASIFERLSDYRPDRARLWTFRQALAEVLELRAPESTVGGELLDISTTMLGVGAVPNYTSPRCYLQATTKHTEIKLFLSAPAAGQLQLTHRRRGGAPAAVEVVVGGVPVGTFASSAEWTVDGFDVPAAATTAGLNVVEVRWPGPTMTLAERIDQDVDALARGEQPYVLPMFGELYSVTFSESR
jgi:hypothetical protein